MPEQEWRYTKDEPTPDELHDPGANDGCKDCCSLILGTLSLTGLVALLVPVALRVWL